MVFADIGTHGYHYVITDQSRFCKRVQIPWHGASNAWPVGRLEEAIKDLHLASKLDYDEEISAVLKKAAYEKAKKQEQSSSIRRPGGVPRVMPGGFPGSMPGGMPGGFPGSMPGGMPETVDYSKILNLKLTLGLLTET
ncbi:unnamed protein product [Fraxinus pennsylvanica]|uniref:Uncharacterized protein n=1 Tax=Fraxinus pennsylvanica TaxID=56036 RepID=A0AAD2AAI5_9LAMI|nr:unnamed protein product [Fraxinus pennsylvanica]